MIVKVQKALGGDGAGRKLRVYNEDRSVTVELDVHPKLIQRLLDLAPKAYFEAELNASGELVIRKRVEDQPW